MKLFSMCCALALVALSSSAWASDYADDVAPPSGFANFQEDVVVGEETPVPSMAPEAYEGAPVEGYGYAPSWSGGCCEGSNSHHDHLWDNYCAERHSGWRLGCGRCCTKAFKGCGGFSKGCCEPKCGKGCRRWHLPKLHMPRLCCSTKSFKGCGGFSKGCCEPKCGKGCRRWHLPKLTLFSRKGCCAKGCKGGDAVGEVIYEGPADVNEVPVPAMEEMPGEVPVPPMVDPAA
jgi:hypothetical protein